METSLTSKKIAVLGAGSWGTTLSWLLANNDKQVSLWSRDAEKVTRLQERRQVEKPLSVNIPAGVEITDDLQRCLDGAGVILFCCSAQSMRTVAQSVARSLAARVGSGAPLGIGQSSGQSVLVSAAKGIELQTFQRMTQILSSALPGHPVCALSGPNLAVEVLRGLPTASVVACDDESIARLVQQHLSVPTFRLYTNTDVIGVELGGALKNIIAIAAGAVDGLNLGTNAKSALMTRGLAEMVRFAEAMGAKPNTLSGLSGVGDLVATCYSSLSRNYRLGYEVARGGTLEKVMQDLGSVAEGVTTARAVCEVSQKLDILMPIAEQVDAALQGKSTPEKAIMTLMARPLASE
jgi:glycerol-3-phosphate dehydrogenase (NAD(P)+)